MPLLAAMTFAVASFGVAYSNKSAMTHAAGVGAYKGALSRSAFACENEARAAAPGVKDLTVECVSDWVPGHSVRVTLTAPMNLEFLFWRKAGTLRVTTTDIVR